MSDSLSEQDLDAVRAVIEHSTLQSIEYYEMSAKRYDTPPELEDPNAGQVNIVVQQRSDATSFGVRLNANIVIALGEANVSVAGEYKLKDSAVLTTRSLQLFANDVAVMTVFPYLREAVASITGRVFNQPLHLPMVSRGQIAIDILPDDPQTP